MSFIIIVDMRENCGEILAMKQEDEQWLAQFNTEEEAYQCMKYHSLNVFPYEVIDMGERDEKV